MTPATIRLLPREPPLTPAGVAATGGAARGRLAAATLRRVRAGADLRVAAGDGWLVVLGAADALPWADGCVYLGRDGGVLMATTRCAWPSIDLVARALGEAGGDAGLLVLLDDAILRGPLPQRSADPALLARLAA